MCLDGVAYTKEEMSQWFGEAVDQIWNEAQVIAQDDWQQTYSEATAASAAEHGASSAALFQEDRETTNFTIVIDDLAVLTPYEPGAAMGPPVWV